MEYSNNIEAFLRRFSKHIFSGRVFSLRYMIYRESEDLKRFGFNQGISEERHRIKLLSLVESVKYDRFNYILDLRYKRIENLIGVKEWLGYDSLTVLDFIKIIHPNFRELVLVFWGAVSELIYQINDFEDVNTKFIIHLPLIDYKGNYLLCKHSISVWQWQNKINDKNGRKEITHLLNEFTIIDHQTDLFAPHIYPKVTDNNGKRIKALELEITKNSQDYLTFFVPFTNAELRILTIYANNSDITSKEIANLLIIEMNTIMTHNKNIVAKWKWLVEEERNITAKEVARILRDNLMI